MIGSHNSLTCFPPLHWWMRPFSFIWKCQDMSLGEQLKIVEYFDIRVRFDKKGKIVCCHGLTDLDCYPGKDGLEYLLLKIGSYGKICRVMIERGEDKGIMKILGPYLGNIVVSVVIKKGWKILYSDHVKRRLEDYTYIPFYSNRPWYMQLKELKISTPKRWARKYNPDTSFCVKDNTRIHFMDFVKNKR